MDRIDHMRIICVISFIGVVFSGYFSYSELLLGKCPAGGCAMLLVMGPMMGGFGRGGRRQGMGPDFGTNAAGMKPPMGGMGQKGMRHRVGQNTTSESPE